MESLIKRRELLTGASALAAYSALPAHAQFNSFPPGAFTGKAARDSGGAPVSPITDLGNKQAFSGSQTITTSALLSAVATGKLVVVFVFDGNVSLTGVTVTDTKSNTYTRLASVTPTSTDNNLMFYSFITTPLTTSDTITYTAATGFGSTTLKISAAWATGYTSIDSATTNTANNFSTTYSVTGAGSASVSNELYFGYVGSFGTLAGTPAGWTTNPPSTPDVNQFLAAWKINTGTSALTFTGTVGSQFWGAIIASFKP